MCIDAFVPHFNSRPLDELMCGGHSLSSIIVLTVYRQHNTSSVKRGSAYDTFSSRLMSDDDDTHNKDAETYLDLNYRGAESH